MNADSLKYIILNELQNLKGCDIVCFDSKCEGSIADYMIIANTRSQRHLDSVADGIAKVVKKDANISSRRDGLPQHGWIIIDASYIMVSLFTPEVRNRYNLEELFTQRYGEPRYE